MRFAVSSVYGNALDPPIPAHDGDVVNEDLALSAKPRRQWLPLVFGARPAQKRDGIGQSMLRDFLSGLRNIIAFGSGRRFRAASARGADEGGASRQ